jgi:hypothetical protein
MQVMAAALVEVEEPLVVLELLGKAMMAVVILLEIMAVAVAVLDKWV